MRPVCVFANSPGEEIERLRADLQGRWRHATRAVTVLLSLQGLSAARIAGLLECHPATVRRWIGRFLSEDPAFPINPYPYVSNDPINARDPSGKAAATENTVINNRIAGKAAEASLGRFATVQIRVISISGAAVYRIIDAVGESGILEFWNIAY